MPSRLQFVGLVAFVVTYVALAELSRILSFPNVFAALWLPAGFVLAIYASTSKKQWWFWIIGSVASSFVYNLLIRGNPIGVVVGFTLANVTRTLLGALLLQSWLPGRFRIEQIRDVLVFTVGACLLAPISTGIIGSFTVQIAYGTSWLSSFPIWYFGNVVGMMMMAPLTLVFLSRLNALGLGSGLKSGLAKKIDDRGPKDLGSWLYFFFLTLQITAISIGVFRFSSSPTMYLISLPLLWIVIRFELVGASAACFIVAVALLIFTTEGYGPIAAGHSVQIQTIISQSFLTTVGLVTLILATSLRSQRKAVGRIQRSQHRLAGLQRDLQQSNQDLERFAIVASHDLKEPLRAVAGYCQFLKEDYGDTLEPEAIGYVDKAIEGADRMSGMINDLLEYSRVSRATFDLEAIELSELIAKVLDGLQSQITQTGTLLEVGQLPRIDGCEMPLIQLFQNLISNAIKFVPAETTPRIVISGIVQDGQVAIEIKDNGIGIAPKHQTRIFQIFQRLHRRSDFSGSGLGLAICDRIMSRHGGRIQVESVLGQGATFRLLFPVPSIIAPSNGDALTSENTGVKGSK